MAITPLPAAPSRQSPSDFSVKADALVAALPTFVTEANAQAAALELNSTTSNSTTSLAIGTGAKSLTVDVSKSYQPGMSVKIARTAAPSNWMHGDVTSYNSGTGALVVLVSHTLGSGTFTDWTITFSAPIVSVDQIFNLKPTVNAAANKLDVFTKSGGAVPDAANVIGVQIPDGNGHTFRSRAAAYLSGTSQIIMADAANYWGKGSLDAEIKTAWLYAIWDGTGIVWALGGYSGFNVVPTTTTATDDDYFLLEDGSTYTRQATDYCVAVAKIRYQYDTADTPDHTIQASGGNAPQITWNPKSDYGYQKNRAASAAATPSLAEDSYISVVVKQAGKYRIDMRTTSETGAGNYMSNFCTIKTGSATYASATQKAIAANHITNYSALFSSHCGADVYLNAGDTIHGGAGATATSGNANIIGDNTRVGATALLFRRVD